MSDPVMSDLGRHMAALDREREDEIEVPEIVCRDRNCADCDVCEYENRKED